jgi:GNAT superfamily N-acetyltransferase
VHDRFRPENLPSRPLGVYAYDGDELVGGACGRTVDVWRWLTVNLMWVDDALRGHGLGWALLGRL